MSYSDSLTLEFYLDKPPAIDLALKFIDCVESILVEGCFCIVRSINDSYTLNTVGERAEWLQAAIDAGNGWVLFRKEGGALSCSKPNRLECFFVSIDLELPKVSPLVDDLVVRCGDLLDAFFMSFSPVPSATTLFVMRLFDRSKSRRRMPDGGVVLSYDLFVEKFPYLNRLPRLRGNFSYVPILELKTIDRIDWLNYWSDEVAELMGLDFSIAEKVPLFKVLKTHKGWYFRLTEHPLDCSLPEDGALLQATYDSLPKVGVRIEAE